MIPTIFGGDTGKTQGDLGDQRKRLAYAMLQQGMDASPIQSPWQGAARLAQALMGGLELRQQNEEQRAATAEAPAAPMGAPSAPPAKPPGFLSSLFGGNEAPASNGEMELAATRRDANLAPPEPVPQVPLPAPPQMPSSSPGVSGVPVQPWMSAVTQRSLQATPPPLPSSTVGPTPKVASALAVDQQQPSPQVRPVRVAHAPGEAATPAADPTAPAESPQPPTPRRTSNGTTWSLAPARPGPVLEDPLPPTPRRASNGTTWSIEK
ncbi:hypothetical protein E0J20_11615 [Rhizobium leguminosarum bv. viciae]|nr:hypothetical protein E0J20_11615 [Rhizobium leguminosarum bv. viciae]